MSFEDLDIDPDSAAAHYYQNAEVFSVQDALTSPNAVKASDASESMLSRGFDGELAVRFDAKGSFINDVEGAADLDEEYPTYTAWYTAASGDYWTIYLYDGDYMASPVSYNLCSGELEVIVTETGMVTSYDYETNSFYRILPDDGLCRVVVVDRIDAEVLDGLSEGELEATK